MNSLTDNIRLGYSQGWSFTPLNGKRPILQGWQNQPHESLEAALEYARQGNVGLRCGAMSAPYGKYLVVIDQDAGGDVGPLNLPPTVTVETANGKHFYFYSTNPLKNTAGRLGEHIDSRGEGGQVVYPGSIHPDSNHQYRWVTGKSPIDMKVADIPQHIEAMFDQQLPPVSKKEKPKDQSLRYALAALEYETANVRNSEEGTRNSILNRAAFSLGTLVAAGNLIESEAEAGLLSAALASGLGRSEALATIRSGLGAGKDKPREIKVKDKPKPVEKAEQNKPFEMTELGNARRLASHFGDSIRYCHTIGKWMMWQGTHWQSDEIGKIGLYAIETVEQILKESFAATKPEVKEALLVWYRKAQSRGRIEGMIHLAKSLPGIPILPSDLDRDKYLFNVKNGTINLRTGELQPHNPNDHITKCSPVYYNEDDTCPMWMSFLVRIMEGSPDMIGFLQQLTGYFLSGDTNEQIFPIFLGTGQNGKSVFIDTVMAIMGPYAQVAPLGLLMESNSSQHATDVAMLMGKRLVQCSESDEGRRLKVGLVKQLTGDKRITARFMRQDNFQFDITHKTLMVTNHKPIVTEDSKGIWRRIRLVPFKARITDEEKDGKLQDKLVNEWPGILRWMVQGFLMWQEQGELTTAAEVMMATEDYREDFDEIAPFLDDCCELNVEWESYTPVTDLYSAYDAWCQRTNHKYTLGRQTFNERLEGKGLSRKARRINGKVVKCWDGLNLKYTEKA